MVNEFLFRDSNTRLEFVEIFNGSSIDIDLSQFNFSDERRVPVTIAREPVTLASGGYAVLVRDTSAFDERYAGSRLQPSSWPALNNGGDAVLLWSGEHVVDSVSFDGSWGVPGRSMERIDPSGPSTNQSNWGVSEDPSGGTPGYRNSLFSPDSAPPSVTEIEEWIDGSLIVYVSEPLDQATLPLVLFRFPSGDRPLSYHLSADGTAIILQPWPGADISSLSVEGLVDLAGNRAEETNLTVLRQPRPHDKVLNEILFEPNADAFDGLPDQREFVEVRSRVRHPLALRGVFLTGRTDETGSSDTLRTENRPMRLHDGGIALFYAAGTAGVPIDEAFPSLPPDSISARAPVPRQTLLLDNHGDTVRLHSADGLVLDEISYLPSWHLPERSATRGISIERVSPWTPSDLSSNWTSSVSVEGATPGRENSVFTVGDGRGSGSVSISPSPFSPDGDGWEDFAQIDVATGRPASSLAVWIFDSAGRRIRTITDALAVGPKSALVWDGRDDSNRPVSTGIFIVYVESVDSSVGDVRHFRRAVVVARPM